MSKNYTAMRNLIRYEAIDNNCLSLIRSALKDEDSRLMLDANMDRVSLCGALLTIADMIGMLNIIDQLENIEPSQTSYFGLAIENKNWMAACILAAKCPTIADGCEDPEWIAIRLQNPTSGDLLSAAEKFRPEWDFNKNARQAYFRKRATDINPGP